MFSLASKITLENNVITTGGDAKNFPEELQNIPYRTILVFGLRIFHETR